MDRGPFKSLVENPGSQFTPINGPGNSFKPTFVKHRDPNVPIGNHWESFNDQNNATDDDAGGEEEEEPEGENDSERSAHEMGPDDKDNIPMATLRGKAALPLKSKNGESIRRGRWPHDLSQIERVRWESWKEANRVPFMRVNEQPPMIYLPLTAYYTLEWERIDIPQDIRMIGVVANGVDRMRGRREEGAGVRKQH